MISSLFKDSALAADIHWALRQRRRGAVGRYAFHHLPAILKDSVAWAEKAAQNAPRGKKIGIFATLHYWVEHAAMLGLAMSAKGHQVTLATLPYADWRNEISTFQARQNELYTRETLAEASRLLNLHSLLSAEKAALPAELEAAVAQVSLFDTQYTLQVEDVATDHPLYLLRVVRNRHAAQVALAWLQTERPDVVLVPNGLILELAMVYRVARFLGIDAITYEFNDHKEQIWMALNHEIMRQDTDALWQARGAQPLTEEQWQSIQNFEAARRGARLWGKLARYWQTIAAQGTDKIRAELGLDARPIVLLATNVLGDSLTLGRQAFSTSMSEWIARTMHYFADKPQYQLVVRVHPGESLTRGPSLEDVIRAALPEIPAHFRVISAKEKVNTYDLIDTADFGLAYTTTTGLEMALAGKPVVLGGKTHYRGRGFTYDPNSYDEYFSMLDALLAKPGTRLDDQQIETAWNYAYRFFFEFAQPFPWRVLGFKEDIETWTMERVLSPDGESAFEQTFRHLAGEPIKWN
jgi:hypothetical protein